MLALVFFSVTAPLLLFLAAQIILCRAPRDRRLRARCIDAQSGVLMREPLADANLRRLLGFVASFKGHAEIRRQVDDAAGNWMM